MQIQRAEFPRATEGCDRPACDVRSYSTVSGQMPFKAEHIQKSKIVLLREIYSKIPAHRRIKYGMMRTKAELIEILQKIENNEPYDTLINSYDGRES